MNRSDPRCAIRNAQAAIPAVNFGNPLTFTYSNHIATANRCEACGYIFFDAPDQALLDQYYQVDYPRESSGWYTYENDHRPNSVQDKANLIETIVNGLTFERSPVLHEFGCSFGGIVKELASRGHAITGSELNASAVEEGRRRGNDLIFDKSASEVIAEVGKVDFLYSFHTLEHFSRPLDFIAQVPKLLGFDGALALALPNGFASDALSRGYAEYPWFFYPGHLHLWSPSSIACLADHADMAVVDVFTRTFNITDRPRSVQVSGNNAVLNESMRAKLMNACLMGEELIAVMVPRQSPVAERLSDRIKKTAIQLEKTRRLEAEIWSDLQNP